MKILYVNPGKIKAGLDYVIKGPPLSLLAISAMVPNHEATLFDFKVDNEKKFSKLLQEHDLVAITSMTPQIDHAKKVATLAKQEGKITIIGGYHPTLAPNDVISHSDVDYIVRGEGEHTFKELIDYIDGNQNEVELNEIDGVSYRDENGNIVHNEKRPIEPNLDNFPLPKWELLQGKKYQYMGTKVMLMETSRGCPHKCSFCCIIKMWNDNDQNILYRKKSVKRVMQEVYKIYNLKHQSWDFIFFNDDNFTIDVKRTDKILDALIKSHMNEHFHFSCQSRVDTLTNNEWLAPKMGDAGFKQVFLGIESVHQQSLDAMGKRTNADMIQKACTMCHENGMSIFAGIIIGYPGETKEMVRENIEFTKALNPDFVQFTPITAFPGTPFFEEMERKGRIATENYTYYNLFHPMMRTEELSQMEIYELVGEAYAKFYLNPGYMKTMFTKALFDPKFKWYLKISHKWLKQFAKGGWAMLRSQGITFDMARQDEKLLTRKSWGKDTRRRLKRRYKRFKHLVKKAMKNDHTIKSPAIRSVMQKLKL